jgi:hypothetical protein
LADELAAAQQKIKTLEAAAAAAAADSTAATVRILVVKVHTGRVFVGNIPAAAELPDADETPSRLEGTLQQYPELFAFLEPAWTGRCIHPGELMFDGSDSDKLLLALPIAACARVEDHRVAPRVV